MLVYRSRFSPDFPVDPTGEDYPFEIGDKARFVKTGSKFDGEIVTVLSEVMYSEACKADPKVKAGDGLVYEVTFQDGLHATAREWLHHIRGEGNSIDKGT